MSTFGWCYGPENSNPQHDACPYEVGSGAGIVRCACWCHEGHPGKSGSADTISSEGQPRANESGPLTRTARLGRGGAMPIVEAPTGTTQTRAGGLA